MQNVQNLTNRRIDFQGVSIEPYGTASFARITDYVGLSRLLNSGKVRSYVTKDKPVVEVVKPEVKVVVEEVVEKVETPAVEDVVEVAETPVKVEEVVEPVEKEELKDTETNTDEVEDTTTKKTTKRKSSKK